MRKKKIINCVKVQVPALNRKMVCRSDSVRNLGPQNNRGPLTMYIDLSAQSKSSFQGLDNARKQRAPMGVHTHLKVHPTVTPMSRKHLLDHIKWQSKFE